MKKMPRKVRAGSHILRTKRPKSMLRKKTRVRQRTNFFLKAILENIDNLRVEVKLLQKSVDQIKMVVGE